MTDERIIGAHLGATSVQCFQHAPGAAVIVRYESPERLSYIDIAPEDLPAFLVALSEADVTVSREG